MQSSVECSSDCSKARGVCIPCEYRAACEYNLNLAERRGQAVLRAEGAVQQERTNVRLCQSTNAQMERDNVALQNEVKSAKLQRWVAAGVGFLLGAGATAGGVYLLTR